MKKTLVQITIVAGLSIGMATAGFGALVGHWTFDPGLEQVDLTGNFPNLSLEGDATVSGGALDVNGSGTTASGWAYTTGGSYIGPAIGEKTLVSWVELQDLNVRAGSALTLDRVGSDLFDGIIWAEQNANRWMNGSNGFNRTTPFNTPADVGSTSLAQLAITYTDSAGAAVVTGYLDGVLIGSYTQGTFGTWATGDAEAIFGKRHGNPATSGPGGLDALIHEARIYDTALSQAEIQALQMVPEPSTSMFGLLAAMLFALRRRR